VQNGLLFAKLKAVGLLSSRLLVSFHVYYLFTHSRLVLEIVDYNTSIEGTTKNIYEVQIFNQKCILKIRLHKYRN
jgi:hypothetical protein